MSAERFLDLASERGFLHDETVAELRGKVRASKGEISPQQIANWLVKNGYLTTFQSNKLLDVVQRGITKTEGGDQVPAAVPPPDLPPAQPSDSLQPLVPLEEDDDEDEYTLLEATAVEDSDLDLAPESSDSSFDVLSDDDSAADVNAVVVEPVAPPLHQDIPLLDNIGVETSDGITAEELEDTAPLGQRHRRWPFGGGRRSRGQRWDSTLMLLGGGALLLLILVGGGLYYFLTVGSGDEVFQLAEDDYKSQLYNQAISKYDRFLSRFPRHPKVSLARVRRSLARMRQQVEAKQWDRALNTVREQLEQIRGEASFADARPELAGILPEIYRGYIQEAMDAADSSTRQQQLAASKQVLRLIEDPELVPSSLRRRIQATLERAAEDVALIEREIERDREMRATISGITAAIQAGDSTKAYELRDTLIRQFPGVMKNQAIQDVVRKISQAELGRVRTISIQLPTPAVQTPSPPLPSVILTRQTANQATGLAERVVFVLAHGAIYAIDADRGGVLWRRWVGFESTQQPVALGPRKNSDAIVWDGARQELMRLDARTGNVVWQVSIGEPTVQALMVEDRVMVALQSGKLVAFDKESGEVRVAAQFPQQLSAAPGYDPRSQKLYVAAGHASLFVLDADTLAAIEVVHVGHAEGMVTVPATPVGDHVIVLENRTAQLALMHVFARNNQGTSLARVGTPVRLNGAVHDPPIRFGRNILIVTEAGAVYVFESDAAGSDEPVRPFAERRVGDRDGVPQYARIAGGRLFVAGGGLAEFTISASRAELNRTWVRNVDDLYIAPPATFGNVIISQRLRRNSVGTIVDAIRLAPASEQDPEVIWETELAVPPAGPAFVDADNRRIVVVGKNGTRWDITSQSFREGRVDQVGESDFRDMLLREPVAIGRELLLFPTASGQRSYLLLDTTRQDRRLTAGRLNLREEKLACPPVAMGDRLLVCALEGPVYVVDPRTGESVARPYEPNVATAARGLWLSPAVTSDATAIIADGDGALIEMKLEADPAERLVAARSQNLDTRLMGSVAAVGDVVYAVERTTKEDRLVVVSRSDLREADKIPLAARVAKGPVSVGDYAALTTADDKLHAFSGDGKRAWSIDLPDGPLAGWPLATAGQWICASASGRVLRLSEPDGRLIPWDGNDHLAVGQPLGASPTLYGARILFVGRDGTVFVALIPQAANSAADAGASP